LSQEFFGKKHIPAIIGAGICLFFVKSGIFSIFFLVPIGFLGFKYNYRMAWYALVLAIPANLIMSLGSASLRSVPFTATLWDNLYFISMALIFALIIAPPPQLNIKLSGAARFMIGSCLGALVFTGIFYRAMISPGFSDYVNYMMRVLVSVYQSSGSDVVQKALLESFTGEAVLKVVKSVLFRGGGLVSCVFLFFLSRQLSLVLVRLSFRIKGRVFPAMKTFMVFHVSPALIWVLSLSLLLVVLSRVARLEIPEIFLWNILIICIILYFAQGLGIVQFFLSRPSMLPFLRLFLIVLFIVLIFSPVVNVILFVGIILLGIAENWAPFRASKPNGPPSTPEAGGS